MAGKIHGRKRRYMADKKGRSRRKRPKTFSSEESAKTWAGLHNIKNFELKNLKNSESKTKKILVVPK